jgi:hypothetical protein
MSAVAEIVPPASAIPETSPAILQALAILVQASEYASKVGRDPWEFAVEITVLREAGSTHSDLRWLRCRELVDHATEITEPGDHRRVFRPTANISFSSSTCFVLTSAGARFALLARGQTPGTAKGAFGDFPQAPNGIVTPVIPVWDRELQILRLGDLVVKQFKTPAPNQEAILSAFQEESWLPRIDDPIPPQHGQDSKTRLHDTVNALNRNQKHCLIRFMGDGSGQGVRWELINGLAPALGEANAKAIEG